MVGGGGGRGGIKGGEERSPRLLPRDVDRKNACVITVPCLYCIHSLFCGIQVTRRESAGNVSARLHNPLLLQSVHRLGNLFSPRHQTFWRLSCPNFHNADAVFYIFVLVFMLSIWLLGVRFTFKIRKKTYMRRVSAQQFKLHYVICRSRVFFRLSWHRAYASGFEQTSTELS